MATRGRPAAQEGRSPADQRPATRWVPILSSEPETYFVTGDARLKQISAATFDPTPLTSTTPARRPDVDARGDARGDALVDHLAQHVTQSGTAGVRVVSEVLPGSPVEPTFDLQAPLARSAGARQPRAGIGRSPRSSRQMLRSSRNSSTISPTVIRTPM